MVLLLVSLSAVCIGGGNPGGGNGAAPNPIILRTTRNPNNPSNVDTNVVRSPESVQIGGNFATVVNHVYLDQQNPNKSIYTIKYIWKDGSALNEGNKPTYEQKVRNRLRKCAGNPKKDQKP